MQSSRASALGAPAMRWSKIRPRDVVIMTLGIAAVIMAVRHAPMSPMSGLQEVPVPDSVGDRIVAYPQAWDPPLNSSEAPGDWTTIGSSVAMQTSSESQEERLGDRRMLPVHQASSEVDGSVSDREIITDAKGAESLPELTTVIDLRQTLSIDGYRREAGGHEITFTVVRPISDSDLIDALLAHLQVPKLGAEDSPIPHHRWRDLWGHVLVVVARVKSADIARDEWAPIAKKERRIAELLLAVRERRENEARRR